jgi:formylmethanofuran dehydrogenase subunit E
LVTLEQKKIEELDVVLRKAEEFHGHLGPFLVLGVRMGIIGVRELGAKGNNKLRVTAMVKDSPPFSCVIDGIQVATKCTIGNKKLRLKNFSGITAKFELPNREHVTVAVNPASFDKLKKELLAENVPPEEVRRLAQLVASMPEEELFIIRRT